MNRLVAWANRAARSSEVSVRARLFGKVERGTPWVGLSARPTPGRLDIFAREKVSFGRFRYGTRPFIPKGLRHAAQGCESDELPWVGYH